ncbi:PBS lyase heat domain protein repeat-containing protein [Methylobacterium sp. 4-46]|uniref:HEAT repeat domain-containing protein n=1 Tax=unclassified Methylobacterium TaxID=2615210 RepID=UPI000152D4CE|nr:MULTISPECIES: HEAT repeat domain-containing protein [Methylobacterium]ACA16515.1 PBS lyase heat domain protein repeat-containing protein [Methylobacterium sp. 4-46]WFT82224.1 HEAT repeat domain-containing protein [Methylobacterium nodulans]
MPLIRRDPPGCAPPGPAAPDDLTAPEPERRLAAIRALSGRREAAGALGEALGREGVPRVREALLSALIACADPQAAAALAAHLGAQDPALRNACVEALQDMPAAVLPLLPDLLADPDPDVRLLAAGVARAQPPETATRLLAGLLDGETHPNVCGAAVEVLAETGTALAVPALRAARARFSAEPFLPGAIDHVLSRLAEAP